MEIYVVNVFEKINIWSHENFCGINDPMQDFIPEVMNTHKFYYDDNAINEI